MALRRAALLVVALLVAGCLQEPAPPAAAGEEILVDVPLPELVEPVPTPEVPTVVPTLPANATPPEEPENWTVVEPTPDPAGNARVLFESRAGANASDSAPIQVPEGTLRLRLALDANGSSWSGVVELKAPDGATMAACLGAPCETAVDGPLPGGRWELRYPPGAAGEVAMTVVAIVEEVAPVPVPTPAPAEETQRVLYKRVRSFDDSELNRTHTDAFAVSEGYDRLAVKVHTEQPIAAGQVRMLVLDPSWKLRGSCDASEERCVVEASDPAPGLWRINYTGLARVRSNVTAWGLAVDDVPLPANLSVQDARHAFTLQPGGNASGGFYAVSGYGRLLVSISFDHPLPLSDQDRPRVFLYDPAGRAWLCEPGALSRCPREVPAVEGRWYAYYFGPATGTVTVRAHLYPGAPQPDEPPAQGAPIPPTQFYMRDVRYGGDRVNQTDWINVHSTAARLTGFIYVDVDAGANGSTAVARLYDPGGNLVTECVGFTKRECPVDVPATWSGRWQMHFSGEGRGFARASLNYSDEAGYLPQAGHYHTAYDTTHAWHSWINPPAFREGFTMLPGWSRVNVTIEFVKVAADDGNTTAEIGVHAPDGSAGHVCTRANGNRACTFEMAARTGLWEITYRGHDSSSDSKVTVRVHG